MACKLKNNNFINIANKNAIKIFKKKLYEGKTGILQVLEYIKIQIAI